jgi:prepilin signal peptidase PulO-like enzyme (type II secretory pathway)
MESLPLATKIIVSLLYGIVLGVVTIPLSKKLALSRTEDPAEVAPLNRNSIKALSLVLGLAASVGLMFTADAADLYIRNVLLLIPIFALSFVDAVVRKIPNSCLLSMLVVELVYVIYHCTTLKQSDDVFQFISGIFLGFFVGMVVCFIPSLLHIPMGAGDIKYSGVIGICLYATGYFQSMIIMAILVALCYAYLKLSKKGGMKTQVPMGPFLSAGTVATMCFSIFTMLGTDITI